LSRSRLVAQAFRPASRPPGSPEGLRYKLPNRARSRKPPKAGKRSVRPFVQLQRPGRIERPRIEGSGPLRRGVGSESRQLLARDAKVAKALRQSARAPQFLEPDGQTIGGGPR